MSDFLYCLNTSTIRPTPLLEKIRIAGAAGYQAIEPWNDEITDYLEQGGSLGELEEGAGRRRAEGRQRDRPAWLGHGRGRRIRQGPRRMPPADGPGGGAGEPLHRRQPPAGGGRPGPGHRAVRRAARARQECGGDSVDGVPRVRRRDQERSTRPGRSPGQRRPPTRRWSPTSST